ncbi:MAG: conserved phage C-terminal domain-containing protein [Pantoea sp.]|uniref:conserved phage C-terminal domain-containing protein n=1 Tax=Pantoea sp. TaxID=69393 RepID=UPI0039E55C4B
MSVKLSAYVWDGCAASGMKITSVAIMARLADFSSDEGLCWPSIATIARQIGAGPSTVRTSLRKLESEGWLTTTPRRKGNRNNSNMYQLNVKKLREAAALHLSESDAPESDTSKSDESKSGASVSDASKSDAPESDKNTGFHPPESGDDPSVNSKHDPSDKNTSCQVASQPDRDVVITDLAKQVLTHLNQTTGSKFQVSRSSLENIRARLAEGYEPDELKLVVDYKNEHWRNTEQEQYLRPATLFIPKNFPGYLQSATKWDKSGRPPCVNGRWQRDVNQTANVDYTIPDGWRGA